MCAVQFVNMNARYLVYPFLGRGRCGAVNLLGEFCMHIHEEFSPFHYFSSKRETGIRVR